MSNVFTLLLTREARLLFRRPAELANPLVFFAIVIALFPLAVGPESQLLQTLSPGLIWVAALSFQSSPAEASFDAGNAWGMPYAPLLGLVAFHCHPDSLFHSHTSAS